MSFAFLLLAPWKAWGGGANLQPTDPHIKDAGPEDRRAWVLDDIIDACTGLPPHCLLHKKYKVLFVKPQHSGVFHAANSRPNGCKVLSQSCTLHFNHPDWVGSPPLSSLSPLYLYQGNHLTLPNIPIAYLSRELQGALQRARNVFLLSLGTPTVAVT